MYAAWRGVMLLVVIFASLIGVGVLGAAFIVSVFFAPNITHQHTLIHQGQIYHLAIIWRSEANGPDFPIKDYVVYQCDDGGWICRQYATPYSNEFHGYESTEFKKFYSFNDHALFIDSDQILRLRVGDKIYPVNANANIKDLTR
jgi:hypothetical protein